MNTGQFSKMQNVIQQMISLFKTVIQTKTFFKFVLAFHCIYKIYLNQNLMPTNTLIKKEVGDRKKNTSKTINKG